MSEKQEFLYMIRATRPGFVTEEPYPEEMEIMGEHFEYVKKLYAEGKIVLIGPALDRAVGIGVFLADSLEEMQELANNDPAVKKGIMSVEIHPFRTALLQGRD